MANQEKLGYVISEKKYKGECDPQIDLGLATSPIGPAHELLQLLKDWHPDLLSQYPKDPFHSATGQLIIDALGLKEIDHRAILFSDNGSYGAGDEVIRYLALKNFEPVYVPSYSFPNVSQWAARHGKPYVPIVSPEDLHPSLSWKQVLKKSDSELKNAILYIDYPNNPFGYTNPDLLKEIILKAERSGGVALVDLAFGEVLGNEFNEIIQFTIDHGGVVICSLSKTQGLPGLRVGYAIMSQRFLTNSQYESERLVFGLSNLAEFVCWKLFEKREDGSYLAGIHAARVAEYNLQTNPKFYDFLTSLGLEVCPTDFRTAIQVVRSDLPDFYQRLAKVGIKSESLADYKVTLGGKEGYGDSAVRLLTPPPQMMKAVLEKIKIAIS